jgi:hypothetical protein
MMSTVDRSRSSPRQVRRRGRVSWSRSVAEFEKRYTAAYRSAPASARRERIKAQLSRMAS